MLYCLSQRGSQVTDKWILNAVIIIITIIIIQFLLIHPVLSNPWETASASFPLWLQLINWLKKTTHPSFIVAVQSLSCVQLFATPWAETHQAFLSLTISWSLLKSTSVGLMMPSNHLIFGSPLPVFSNESAIHIRWPKYWGFFKSPIFRTAPSFGGIYKNLRSHFNQCQTYYCKVYPRTEILMEFLDLLSGVDNEETPFMERPCIPSPLYSFLSFSFLMSLKLIPVW